MNHYCTTKTRPVWHTLQVKIGHWKVGVNRHSWAILASQCIGCLLPFVIHSDVACNLSVSQFAKYAVQFRNHTCILQIYDLFLTLTLTLIWTLALILTLVILQTHKLHATQTLDGFALPVSLTWIFCSVIQSNWQVNWWQSIEAV